MSRTRIVNGGTAEHTEIRRVDQKDRSCGAYHRYTVLPIGWGLRDTDCATIINFQRGAIKASGVNGCSNEDLLAIVKDRLKCLQKGRFPCAENNRAIEHIGVALSYLYNRTADRKHRGVEGQHKA